MQPEQHLINEWVNRTTLHPVGMAAMIALGLAMLVVPRRWAVTPIILLACFISPGQRVVIVGSDFDFMRLMVICGWARLFLRSEFRTFRPVAMDWWVFAFMASSSLLYVVREASMQAVIYRTGWLLEAMGMYFLLRHLVRSLEDVYQTARVFSIVAVPVAIAFLIERATGRNVFSVFGGVPEITQLRDGRLRCQGAFAHPIVAGCFWAALLPIVAAQWWRGHSGRILTIVGAAAALCIIINTASSTPLMAVMFAAVGGAAVVGRWWLGWVRWGFVFLLVALHMSMKQPVWHLVARIDIVSGSTGYHRFLLMDAAIRNFPDWFLMGIPSTEYWGEGLHDITNHYILVAVTGGAIPLAAFLGTIVLAFKSVGRAWRKAEWHRPSFVLAWGVGVAIFVHCTSFLALSYFGQVNFLWYLTLAITAALPAMVQPRVASRAASTARDGSVAAGASAVGRHEAAGANPRDRRELT